MFRILHHAKKGVTTGLPSHVAADAGLTAEARGSTTNKFLLFLLCLLCQLFRIDA